MKGLFFKKHHIEAFKKIFFLKKLSSGLGKQNSIVLAGHLNCIISSLTYAPNYLSLWVISFLFAHSCLCLQCMLVLHIALPIRCRNYDMFNLAFFFSWKRMGDLWSYRKKKKWDMVLKDSHCFARHILGFFPPDDLTFLVAYE